MGAPMSTSKPVDNPVEAFLQPHDGVAISFWIISIAMIAAVDVKQMETFQTKDVGATAMLKPLYNSSLENNDDILADDKILTNKKELRIHWLLAEAPPKPELFILERTSFVVDGPVTEVTSKLQEILRIRSCYAFFDNNIAKCKTPDFTKFHVNLFDAGEGQVTVEVQRRNGCSMAFRAEYTAIMSTLKKNEVCKSKEQIEEERERMPPLRELLGDKYIPLPEGQTRRSLEMALKYFETGVVDQVQFALKEFICLTSSADTKVEASGLLLKEPQYKTVRDHILQIIQNPMENDDDERKEYQRHLALTIFTNILKSLSEEKKLGSFIGDDQFYISTVQELMKKGSLDQDTAAKYPSNVCLSLQCLHYLVKQSAAAAAAARRMYDQNGYTIINDVKDYGKQRYYRIEIEADNVLNEM